MIARSGSALVDRLFLAGPIRLPGWRQVTQAEDGQLWVNDRKRLSVIWSVTTELDGRRWLHISIASPDRLPRWDELVQAKEWIAGTDTYAYQVIPPRSKYVDIHTNALHVWVPLEGDQPLPDFTHGGNTI